MMRRVLLIAGLLLITACTPGATNACPASLVVEVDSSARATEWDSTTKATIVSAVGDCLPVHQEKIKFIDSTTYYRVPITATVTGTTDDEYSRIVMKGANYSRAVLRIQAVGANGVVIASDSMLYDITNPPRDQKVSGGLYGLTPAEMSHVAKVRIGFLIH